MSELPNGWVRARLGELAARITKGATPTSYGFKYQSDGVTFVKVENLKHGRIDHSTIRHYISEAANNNQKRSILQDGDILFSIAGTLGEACLVTPKDLPANTNQALAIVRGTTSFFLPQFLMCQLSSQSTASQVREKERGGGMHNLSLEDLNKFEVVLAPLGEQARIIAKLDNLLVRVRASEQRLRGVAKILKRFRQAVLAAACSGYLSADWRNKNSDVEPASALVKKQQFEMIQNGAWLSDLPRNWTWAALGNYGRCSRGRFSIRPRNDPRYFGGNHPFIQIGNLPAEGGWIRSHTQTLNEEGFAVSKEFPKGTAVIAIVGATIGNTGLLAYDMCFPDSMVGIETGTDEGNRYVEIFLRYKKYDVRQTSYSSGGQPNIKLEFLNPYPLALPPLAEQREIVRRVDVLFALADRLENRLKSATAQVENLSQGILAKAFRGELVPTEAALAAVEGRAYESASDLLARVLSESVSQQTGSRTRTATPKTQTSRRKRFDSGGQRTNA
jgi:type I restriction enzyme, S subunit